jgi:hypothetical protein
MVWAFLTFERSFAVETNKNWRWRNALKRNHLKGPNRNKVDRKFYSKLNGITKIVFESVNNKNNFHGELFEKTYINITSIN